MELKQKGADAVIGNFKQLKVSLIWTAPVDLDLMAFYRTKSNINGGIFSDNYGGGSLGDLNAFPFIQLSGDAGVGAVGGDNREELRIAKLDDFEELYIVALNFTDAMGSANKVFADYDARVEVVTDQGESHSVSLDSRQAGSSAVICKFKGSFMGTSLVNNSEVMDFEQLRTSIPGAADLKLASKVVLKQKGDTAPLSGKDFHAAMRWKTAVDLDLHCFYRLKDGALEKPSGLMGRLFKGAQQEGQIYFSNRGSKNKAPWIYLDQDAGVGDTGGANEENIYFTNLNKMEQALIVANIFSKKDASFASYDGVINIKCGSNEIEIPLTEKRPGSWCVIARFDNRSTPKMININQTVAAQPKLEQFL